MALSSKQSAFVREYLKDKNAARSARAAGYSAKAAETNGPRLLRNAQIRKAVNDGLAKQAEKCDISAERTLKRIAEIAYQPLSKQELKTKSAVALKANELLAKHFKLLTDVQELSGKDGGPVVVLTMPANGSEADEK